MSTLNAIQGLLGGLNSGLSNFTDLRKQQAEIANREKLAQVAQMAEERQRMADEWDQQKAAYEAMTSPIEANDPLVGKIVGKLPLIKGADGRLMRPLSKAEQAADIAIKANQLKQEGRDYIGQNPSALNDPATAYQVMAKYGFNPNEIQVGLPVQAAESAAKYAPQMETQAQGNVSAEKIAAGHDASNLASAHIMASGREAALEAQLQRTLLTPSLKEIDPIEYAVWEKRDLPQNKQLVQQMNDAKAQGVSDSVIQAVLRNEYLNYRNPRSVVPK